MAKLLPNDIANDGDRFGLFVSVNGDTAVVGAPFDDDNGGDSGSAYVFSLTDIVPELAIDIKLHDLENNIGLRPQARQQALLAATQPPYSTIE